MLQDVVADDAIERLAGEVDPLEVADDPFVDALVEREAHVVDVDADDVGVRGSIRLAPPSASGFEDPESHSRATR